MTVTLNDCDFKIGKVMIVKTFFYFICLLSITIIVIFRFIYELFIVGKRIA